MSNVKHPTTRSVAPSRPLGTRRWQTRTTHLVIAGACLLLAGVQGYMVRFHGSFGDEGDNLAAAQLMLHGHALYRDIFSHHFPLTYLWVAAWFWLLGPSVFAARMATLALQLGAFASAMVIARRYVAVGVAALAWSAIGLFYYGNLALYQSMGGAALVPVFFYGYTAITADATLRARDGYLAGGWAAVAMLLNPLTIFPVLLTVLCAGIAARSPWRAARVLLTAGVLCGALAGYAALSGALGAFYADAVLFNRTVYPRFNSLAGQNPLVTLLENGLYGLHIFTPDKQMFPLAVIEDYSAINRWLLGGVSQKLAVLLACGLLLLRRQWLAAIFVYSYTAALLLRGQTNFDAIPLMMLAVCVLALLAGDAVSSISGWTQRATGLLAGGLLLWMTGLGAHYTLTHRATLDYRADFASYEDEARALNRRACGRPALLGYYPGNPYMYFFTNMPPASRYLFLWPWVAVVGQRDVAQALETAPYAVVVFDADGETWGRPNKEHLQLIDRVLRDRYVRVDHTQFVSPKLRGCQP